MKVFGHHVALPAIVLACIDASLFLAALYALGFAGHCARCYLHSVTHLQSHEAILLTAAFVAITASIGLYNRDSLLSFRIFFNRLLLASQFVFVPAVVVVGLGKAFAGLPFGWFIGILAIAIAVFFAVLFAVHVAMRWFLDFSFLKRRVLVVGDTDESEKVVDYITSHGKSHLRCVGHIRDLWVPRPVAVTQGTMALNTNVNVEALQLTSVVSSLRAEEVVIAVKDKRGLPMMQLLDCKLKGVQVTDYLVFWERETGSLDLSKVGPGWLALNEGFRLNWARRTLKRAIDVAVSLVLLTVSLPIFLVVALAIKLDSPVPVFYRQERVGRQGKVFKIWKFRSMSVDAERHGPAWASECDRRITRVGSFIRKFRIDELPQGLNVLKGDMSLIGPRPEQVKFVDELRARLPLYDLRHRVRPGLTGWAQVSYRYGSSFEDARTKLSYDLYYVKNQDLLLDFVILLQTVRVILFAHGSR